MGFVVANHLDDQFVFVGGEVLKVAFTIDTLHIHTVSRVYICLH